ncbi:MAG: VOC family protein [Arachnia sp.]
MQRIVPCIWFNRTAAEAVDFYSSVFPDSRRISQLHYPAQDLPEFQAHLAGEVLTEEFELAGFRFVAVNAGSEFTPTPAVSFFVSFDPGRDADASDRLEEVWARLCEHGRVLMPLQAYPFSPRYGWVEDRYGVSWQLRLSTNPRDPARPIVPCLMFGHTIQGQAHPAIEFYSQVLHGAPGTLIAHPDDGALAGEVMYAEFQLLGQWFSAMDAPDQTMTFTPGVSLILKCPDQTHIDRYWDALSAVPEAEQCGWCQDRFGLSWQIVPEQIDAALAPPGAYRRLLAMKKIDIAALASGGGPDSG